MSPSRSANSLPDSHYVDYRSAPRAAAAGAGGEYRPPSRAATTHARKIERVDLPTQSALPVSIYI